MTCYRCRHCAPGAGSNREIIEAFMGSFIERVREKSAVIGVIGQGYVGLPLALVFNEAGFQVVGFDVDGKKVAMLKQGQSYIKHVATERVAAAVKSGRLPTCSARLKRGFTAMATPPPGRNRSPARCSSTPADGPRNFPRIPT